MINKAITPFVLGLIKKGHKVLLTQRKEIDREDPKDFEGKWQIPGGGINFEEKLELALKREIKEEVSLDIKILGQVPYIIDEIRENWHGLGIVFNCELEDQNQMVKLNSESSSYGWYSLEEALNLEMLPGGKEAIKAAFKFGVGDRT